MSLSTLMQAAPAKANELFARLSETSEGAVKTREKMFAELKAELELHAGLEEQHLFPILRRNAETKEIVTEAIRDNKDLRAKLAQLDSLPKNDATFPDRLKELQKSFRQHARDEKRELLPAVRRALSEQQVQNVAEKIEAGLAEAGQAKQDELDERRLKVRQEREQAERQAERHEAAEQARKIAAEQARRDEAEQKQAKLRAEHDEAERRIAQEARRARDEGERSAREAAETAARTGAAAQASAARMAQNTAENAQRVGLEVYGATIDAMKATVPDLQTVASVPTSVVAAMAEIRSGWMSWIGKTTLESVRMSQELLGQAAERQRRFAAEAARGWMEQNARVMEIATRAARTDFRRSAKRVAGAPEGRANKG